MLHKFYINRSRSRFCSFLVQIYEFWGCSDLWGLLYKFRIYKKAHLIWDFKKRISPWLGLEPTKMINSYNALFFPSRIFSYEETFFSTLLVYVFQLYRYVLLSEKFHPSCLLIQELLHLINLVIYLNFDFFLLAISPY